MQRKLKEEIKEEIDERTDDFDEILNDILSKTTESLSQDEVIKANNFTVKEIKKKFEGLKIISEK